MSAGDCRAEKNADLLVAQTKRTGYLVETFLVVIDIKDMKMAQVMIMCKGGVREGGHDWWDWEQVTSNFLSLVKAMAAIDQVRFVC